MKNLENLTPAEAITLSFFVSELTNEFRQIEECFYTQSDMKLRHELEEFKTFFEAFKEFGTKVLAVAEHKTDNHFKAEKEANNE